MVHIIHGYTRHEILFLCIAGLQNDHKAIMEEIEEELYKIHAEARRTRGEDEKVVDDERVPPSGSERLAFGTVTKLDEGSPANTAVSITTW